MRQGDGPEAAEAGERLPLLRRGRPLLLLDLLQRADGGDDVAGLGLLAGVPQSPATVAIGKGCALPGSFQGGRLVCWRRGGGVIRLRRLRREAGEEDREQRWPREAFTRAAYEGG